MDKTKTDKELGINTTEPRTFNDLRWIMNDLQFNRIAIADVRECLQFFALNASDDELKRLECIW